MPQPVLLVDSDIFRVLGAAGLLDDLAACLGIDRSEVRRLPAIQYQIRQPKFVQGLSREAVARLEAAVASVVALTQEPSLEIQSKLQISGVDPGENLLYGTLYENDGYLLVTGDKRALDAITGEVSLDSVCERIQGRVMTLEAALWALVRCRGAAVVGSRLQPLASIHRTLDVFFGTKSEFRDEETLRQLDSYLRHLHQPRYKGVVYPTTGEACPEH